MVLLSLNAIKGNGDYMRMICATTLLVFLLFGIGYAAIPSFDSGVKKDISDGMVDLDDRYAVVLTPTSQENNKILIVNRRTGQFYKVEMTEIEGTQNKGE